MARKVTRVFISEVNSRPEYWKRMLFDIAGDGDKWKEYEQGKREIQTQNLTPTEYEQAINALCERLGV